MFVDDLEQARTMAAYFVATEAADTDGGPGGDLRDELDRLPANCAQILPWQQPRFAGPSRMLKRPSRFHTRCLPARTSPRCAVCSSTCARSLLVRDFLPK